jgi:hypothetical protein
MRNREYPSTVTVANALERERAGVTWAKQGVEIAHQNLIVAARDIPDTPEYSEVRRAVYRALDRIRDARKALTEAYDTTAEAMLIAKRTEAVPISSQRLVERYGGQRGTNGVTMVRNARKERQRREDDYAAWERRRREEERQRFLKNRKGEGMRENED